MLEHSGFFSFIIRAGLLSVKQSPISPKRLNFDLLLSGTVIYERITFSRFVCDMTTLMIYRRNQHTSFNRLLFFFCFSRVSGLRLLLQLLTFISSSIEGIQIRKWIVDFVVC